MIIKLFLIAIILYIVINQLTCNQPVNDKQIINIIPEIPKKPVTLQTNQATRLQNKNTQDENIKKKSNNQIQEFDYPNPWSKIVYIEDDEYPYYFHFKVVIPSLNDFEKWKGIIPNIDFSPNSKELIIPSKDEASALAIANLICINFSGQMSIHDILSKDLIRISIMKAKTYEVVRNKLKEQIMEVLYGKPFNKVQTNYEEDLAKNNDISNNKPTSLKSENFRDTFEHFSNNMNNNNEISAYDSSNYSYI